MEAGLGLDQALMRVGAELKDNHPDLSDEFNLISLEQRAGTPRIEAWRHTAERTKLEIISSFVSMLVQTDKFGTPISKALAVFSDSLRIQRRQKAEELAAKTTIKMVFPLVFFIFPSMFIVLLAPAFLSIIRNLQSLF
jgi:tight adherence protein C